MSERSFRDPEGTLSKNECIKLIESDDSSKGRRGSGTK